MVNAKLVVVGGAAGHDEFPLELPSVFGRGREASVALPYPLVSRRHCELFERDGQLLVRDLGSTNGTFVGSERIIESALSHGQLLTLGTVTFRVFFDGKPQSLDEYTDEEIAAAMLEDDELADVSPDDSTVTKFNSALLSRQGRPNKTPS